VPLDVLVGGGNVGWTTYRGRHGRLLQTQATLVTAHGQLIIIIIVVIYIPSSKDLWG